MSDRATHAWGLVGVGLAALFGFPALSALTHQKGLPWWVIPGVIFGVICLVAGVVMLMLPRLQRRPELRISVGGCVLMPLASGTQTRVQVTTTVRNLRPRASTLHGWKLTVSHSGGQWQARHVIGEQPAPGSLNIADLGAITASDPLGQGERTGHLQFIVDVPKDDLFAILQRPDAAFLLSVEDDHGRESSGSADLPQLMQERIVNPPDQRKGIVNKGRAHTVNPKFGPGLDVHVENEGDYYEEGGTHE